MSATSIILRTLKRTPSILLRPLSGPPRIVDGFRLDRNIQIVANITERATPDTEPTLEERRKLADDFARDANAPRRRGVRSTDTTIPAPHGELPIRTYEPKGLGDNAPAILFFHQGGLVVFDVNSNDTFCTILAKSCRARVISLEYRLAPEHKFPAAIEDAMTLWTHVQDNADALGIDRKRVGVCGDSAGGLMASVLCQQLRDAKSPQPVAQCLVYPWVVVDNEEKGSMASCSDAFPLNAEMMAFFRDMCFENAAQENDPAANPLKAKDLSNLPPAVVATAGFDPIRDQGNAYADALAKAGVPVTHYCFGALSHSFLIMGNITPAATRASNQIARDFAKLL